MRSIISRLIAILAMILVASTTIADTIDTRFGEL